MTDPREDTSPAEGASTFKPTPARELDGSRASSSAPAPVEEAHIEVGGTGWKVRVLGRSGRASVVATPLVLLGFWKDEAATEVAASGDPAEDMEAEPDLEALVVAHSLEALGPEELEEALAGASRPRDADRAPPFFPEAAQARGR
jgi:hypothetical protein